VAEATDGREALELSRRLKPDLVFMDVIMPEMDGIEATRAIMAEFARTIVLVITASEDSEHL
jgi:CheY-like chemotaxis protein